MPIAASLLRRRPPAPEPSPPASVRADAAGPRRRPAARRQALETVLLRRSLGAQQAHREHCCHCGRTPLTGELVHVYAAAGGERLVCDLCRPARRERPARTELMHPPGHDRSVRVTRRAA